MIDTNFYHKSIFWCKLQYCDDAMQHGTPVLPEKTQHDRAPWKLAQIKSTGHNFAIRKNIFNCIGYWKMLKKTTTCIFRNRVAFFSCKNVECSEYSEYSAS